VLSGSGVWAPRIAPDGRSVVFVRGGKLFVRALDTLVDREVETAGGATMPTWSPDGSSIAYFATGDLGVELRVVSAQGGASRVMARRVIQGAEKRLPPFPPFGVAWCASGLLFTRWAEGLWLVTDDGRESLAFPIDPKAGDTNFAYPSCLPDGRVLAFAEQAAGSVITVLGRGGRVSIGSIDAPYAAQDLTWPVLTPGGGHVLFDRGWGDVGIWALPVNADVTAATGPPRAVLAGGRQPSVSASGLMVATTGVRGADSQLVWVDRTGTKLAAMGRPQAYFEWPSVAPAGDRVVAQGPLGGTDGLWIHGESTARALVAVLRQEADQPAWSPRDDRVAYVSSDGKKTDIVVGHPSGGEAIRVTVEHTARHPAWTPDGRSIVYTVSTNNAIWMLSLAPAGAAKPRRLATGFEPAVSPDGRYLAFTNNSTGQRQVFITTLAEAGDLVPVSEQSGRFPRWGPKGDELIFACGPPVGNNPNSHRDLCAVPFDPRSGRAGRAKVLFNAEALGYELTIRGSRGYDVGPDPNRILVQTAGFEGTPAITVLESLGEWIRRAR
jgi:dipeptidyl aminopeptidase/acylaminoacyl peptidase